MDFKFNLNEYIRGTITKIEKRLMPEGFTGDRRRLNMCVDVISEVIDQLGIASAKAQGLQKAITNADRLRNSDYIVYLLFDPEGNNGRGSVVGMLKTGWKKLYVFDQSGECHHKLSLCVLDFYVHESRQRQGCGRLLFDYMLNDENISPEKLAIDRPSDKFIKFLSKHYGLEKIAPQTNNFVVFDGFFSESTTGTSEVSKSPTPKYGDNTFAYSSRNTAISEPVTYNGRYAAHKPETTIGKCLMWHAPLPKTHGKILGTFSTYNSSMYSPAPRQHRNATSVLSPFSTPW